jgi:phage gp16-like protein
VKDRRKAQLAAIHLGKKQLGWSDDVYRDVIAGVSNGATRSAADLNAAQRARLLDMMREHGFKGPQRPVKRRHEIPTQDDKVRALWGDLVTVGALRDASERALQSFVERQTGKSRIEWCTPEELNDVIEGLKGWLARARRQRREQGR